MMHPPNMSQQMPPQSMVSGGTSMNSGGQANQNAQLSHQYIQEVNAMFMSSEFKNGETHEKKEMVGNTIYKYVEKLVGENKAPKITGMLIDLPEVELNYSVATWTNFFQKVQSAFNLIQESENNAPSGAQGSPPGLLKQEAQ